MPKKTVELDLLKKDLERFELIVLRTFPNRKFKQNEFSQVKRILQKTPSKLRVEFSNGTLGWIDKVDLKENSNKKIY